MGTFYDTCMFTLALCYLPNHLPLIVGGKQYVARLYHGWLPSWL